MKTLFLVFFAIIPALAETPKSCVIVAQHQYRFSENRPGRIPYDYVEGEFPQGMKFIGHLGDKHVQEIRDRGGKVIFLRLGYQLADQKDAREQCAAFISSTAQTESASTQAPAAGSASQH